MALKHLVLWLGGSDSQLHDAAPLTEIGGGDVVIRGILGAR